MSIVPNVYSDVNEEKQNREKLIAWLQGPPPTDEDELVRWCELREEYGVESDD